MYMLFFVLFVSLGESTVVWEYCILAGGIPAVIPIPVQQQSTSAWQRKLFTQLRCSKTQSGINQLSPEESPPPPPTPVFRLWVPASRSRLHAGQHHHVISISGRDSCRLGGSGCTVELPGRVSALERCACLTRAR